MKALKSAGFSSAAVAHLTVDDVRAADSDQVPIAIDTEGETIVNVSADWYDQLQRTRNVVNEMSKNWLGNREGPNEKSGGPKDKYNDALAVWLAGSGGDNPHVRITIDKTSNSKDDTRGNIPGGKNDVRIDVEEADPKKEELLCEPNQKSDTSSLPGGLRVTFSGPEGSARLHPE
jgi:hypothetical protein